MGQTINKTIHTTLSAEEVSYIAVAIGTYIDKLNGKHKEMEKVMKNITNRLGSELYAYPKNDFTKK